MHTSRAIKCTTVGCNFNLKHLHTSGSCAQRTAISAPLRSGISVPNSHSRIPSSSFKRSSFQAFKFQTFKVDFISILYQCLRDFFQTCSESLTLRLSASVQNNFLEAAFGVAFGRAQDLHHLRARSSFSESCNFAHIHGSHSMVDVL